MLVLQQLFNLSDEELEFQVMTGAPGGACGTGRNEQHSKCHHSRLLSREPSEGWRDRGALRVV